MNTCCWHAHGAIAISYNNRIEGFSFLYVVRPGSDRSI